MFQRNPVGGRVVDLAHAVTAWWGRVQALLRRPRSKAGGSGPSVPGARAQSDDLTRVEFERLVRRAFRLQGYRQVRKQPRHDAWNIDLLLFKNGGLWFVQCEPDPASRIDASLVQELADTCQQRGAHGVFLVTAGSFTRQARTLAQAHQVRLVDGQRLASWRQQVRLARLRRARTQGGSAGAPRSVG